MLYIFCGLPATGKTTLAKHLATTIGAVYVRIDTIEQAMKNAGFDDIYDQGYQVAFSLARENLLNGLTVVADPTNPVKESRLAWRAIAETVKVDFKEIEIVCSDLAEHQLRVTHRQSDIAELLLPDWESVSTRYYEPWSSADIVMDTAGKSVEQSKVSLLKRLGF